MASVFLSYDHDDAERAAAIVRALEETGHSVWSDRQISVGSEFNREIESAVERADAVVVLWSERSVQSAWVRDEAAEGRDQGKLVPVLIEPVKPPMGFRQFQTIDLSRGRRNSPDLTELLKALDRIAKPSETMKPAVAAKSRHGLRANRQIAALLALIFGLAGLLAWWLAPRSSGVAVVKVVAADNSAASRGLARDLLVKLGGLEVAKTEGMRLIGAESTRDSPDLVIEASSSNLLPQANVSLMAGKNGSILWSRDFQLGPGGQAAAEQQMAYTAGQVLACALDAPKAEEIRLDQQTLKLFLNGCAQFGDDYYQEPAAVVPTLSQVVKAAPKFRPAWRKLLLAETLVARNEIMFQDRYNPGGLPQLIAAARKLDPNLPEIYVAETELLPLNAYVRRLDLFDKAIRLDPNNPDVLVGRAVHLDAVGRINDALNDESRAIDIDPLSPALRAILILELANSGRLAAAQDQLRQAEALWPDTPTIRDARLRVNMRYGDARDALETLNSDTKQRQNVSPTAEAYLQARIDPTPANIQHAIDVASGSNLKDSNTLVHLMQMLGQFHRENELYQVLLEPRWTSLLGAMSQVYFRGTMQRFRQDRRFMIVAKRAGLVDYWRQSGKWPDFCFEPDLPYDCKKEAAKVSA